MRLPRIFGRKPLTYDLNKPLSFRTDDTMTTPTNAYDVGTDNAIESTCIDEARYDENGDMHIRFVNGNGTEYTYPNVPEGVAKKFRMATSYGKAFHEDIKPYSTNK